MNDAFPSGNSRLTPAVWSLLAACGALHAALMFTPWAWPAIDGYPTIERFIDPNYLPTDFYTNTSGSYGVDTLQAYLFGALQQWTGIGYAQALGFLDLLRCLVFPALLAEFFLALGGGLPVALSAVVLGTLGNFALPKTLGWQWLWGDPSTAMFAILANLLGWTTMMRGQVGRSLAWLGLSAAIHPLTCMHGLALLPLVYVFCYSPEQRRAVLGRASTWLGAGLFLLAFLGQYFALKAGASEQLPIADYVRIVAVVRHPGDFLVERFSAKDILSFSLATAACLWVLVRYGSSIPSRRLVAGVLVLYALIAVSGYLFVSVWPSRFFVQLIPYRMANLVAPFLLYLLGWFCAARLREGDHLTPVALSGCFLVASAVGTRLPRIGANHAELAALGALCLVVFAPLLNRSNLAGWVRSLSQRRWLRPSPRWLAAGLLALAVPVAWARRHEFGIPTVANQHPIYAWLQQATPPDSTVLVDQYASSGTFGQAINPQKVRLVGRRAVVASLDFPFLDKDMRPWEARWEAVVANRTVDRINQADWPTLSRIRALYPFDYVIRTEPLIADTHAELVQQFAPSGGVGPVFVYRIPAT